MVIFDDVQTKEKNLFSLKQKEIVESVVLEDEGTKMLFNNQLSQAYLKEQCGKLKIPLKSLEKHEKAVVHLNVLIYGIQI